MFPALLAMAGQLGSAALSNQPKAEPGIAGPSGSGDYGAKNGIDFSGFTVATGGSRADGAQISKENGLPMPQGGGWLIAGAAVLAVVVLWRAKRRK